MGDAALRVQTRFESAELLMSAVGSALLRGSLRLPLPLKFNSAFEVTLVAADGIEAVRGTAEIVEDAGHATWIRFLSAAPEAPGDDSVRCILADVDIDITAPQEAVVEPVEPQGSEAFEAITAVTGRPAALDAMPSGTAEAVPLLPPPPEPLPPAVIPGASEDSALKGIPPVIVSGELVPDPPVLPEPPVVADSISAAVLSVEAAPDETTPSNSEEIDEKRDTDASPPILLEHRKDTVARERGIEPIAEPYVRESMPVVPQETPRSRRVVIVSMSFAAVCLAVSGGAIIWAQDAVAEAQTKPMANVQPMAPLVVEEQVQARAKPAIEQTIEMEAKPAVEQTGTTPDTCKIAIDASVADSRVKIDGKDRGLTPLSTSVPCGQPMAIEVRHARYATYERTITVTAADEALHAKLEREKTTVTLTSDPPAAVTLNGTPIGKTPMKWTVSRFEQSTFRFSAPGYETDWRRIHPKRDTSTVLLKLKRQR